MTRITLDQLMEKLGDLETPPDELRPYFVIDTEGSGPFAPRFMLNPETVEIPDGPEGENRSALAMNSANWFARMARRGKFNRKLARGYDGPVIVSEGDSWFQYPILLKDTIDHLMDDFAVRSLGAAGDLLEKMAARKEYLTALDDTGAGILLFSGGGNDLVADGALAQHLEPYDPALRPADYLLPSFQGLLDDAISWYERICREVAGAFPHVRVLCHGYDYPVPKSGKWLGKPMERQGINDRSLQKAIAAEMMDRFNRDLRRMARTLPHVDYIDCRGVVGDSRWHDELHPTDAGYGDVANRFGARIREIANESPRSGPRVLVDGPFGRPEAVRQAMLAAPMLQTGSPAVQAISLHLGLNLVDPNHYGGWDGRLRACEADALAMERLARDRGFQPKTLLTADATRAAVVDEIRAVAQVLEPGGMFMMSVSAHGGRVPDFNRDELADGDQPVDETLCLYDFQLIDDELFSLWTEFAAGTRVLQVTDTCHSESMVRMTAPVNAFDGLPALDLPDPHVRAMPLAVADRTWRDNETAYRAVADSLSEVKEDIVNNPLKSNLRASVLNLGACRDTQFAKDGPVHGAFTGALLKIWDGGRFNGDYRQFMSAISSRLNDATQEPQLFDHLVRDPAFLRQVPFTPLGGGGAAVGIGTRPPIGRGPVGEGAEDDPMSDAEVQRRASGAATRDATAASWSDYGDFKAHIDALNLRHFSADEFLILGGKHGNPASACFGKNTPPPRPLWRNIDATARVVDELRARLGRAVVITNAYRAPAYNSCIGGATRSQHKEFTAFDFKVPAMTQTDVAQALRWMRDEESLFRGGIGYYNGFTHVDTRGTNATWFHEMDELPPLTRSPFDRSVPASPVDRLAKVSEIELAPLRRGGPRGSSAFSAAVPRSGEGLDLKAAQAVAQATAQAAVAGGSLVSFTDALTAGQKEDVLLSTLFAQRAADKQHDRASEREAWYGVYVDTLTLLGWSLDKEIMQKNAKMRANGSFDDVILTLMASVISGGQTALLSQAIGVLKGLADDDGIINLFDLSTTSDEGGSFQIGTAHADGDVVSMSLGAFQFNYSDHRKNILFVKWGHNDVAFWLSARHMSLSPLAYADVRDVVAQRMSTLRKALIADVPI